MQIPKSPEQVSRVRVSMKWRCHAALSTPLPPLLSPRPLLLLSLRRIFTLRLALDAILIPRFALFNL